MGVRRERRLRALSVAGLVVSLAGLAAASCSSHKDGGGEDETPDAKPGEDAADAKSSAHDAAPVDAHVADAGVDASDASATDREGGADATGHDAGTDASGHDAGTDAGSKPDVSVPCTTGIPDPATAPLTLDTACFVSTFDDTFDAYDISSGPTTDGLHPNEKWFNGTDQCCMSPSNGWPGVMYPTPGQTTGKPVNPYSLLPGGGLTISLTTSNDEWFSGVMTSVDTNGEGFAQAYGYFEMNAQLAPGTGTWPSFWMLSLPMGTPGGEIDVFEQYGCNPPVNPAVYSIFHYTLHDWKDGTTPAAYTATVEPDLTAGYHRYGLLWNKTYMALYLDGQRLDSEPTPSVMVDVKYFLLADMGVGGGWVTTSTPNPSNLLIKSIRAYSVPGF